jgi:hypothetical protein
LKPLRKSVSAELVRQLENTEEWDKKSGDELISVMMRCYHLNTPTMSSRSNQVHTNFISMCQNTIGLTSFSGTPDGSNIH